MNSRVGFRLALTGILVLVLISGASGPGVAQSELGQPELDTRLSVEQSSFFDNSTIVVGQSGNTVPDVDGEEDDDEEEGSSIIGDWWGLGGEATETPYVGLVELGVLVLTVGLVGYFVGKRTTYMPTQYRRYLLPTHEWSMLIGTALTVPHFVFVEEWEGLGFAVGVLLAIEVLSGLYGRHLHRHVIRLGRGTETAPVVGNLFEVTKETLFSRWRWIHRSLTLLTAIVLVLHIVTAVGE